MGVVGDEGDDVGLVVVGTGAEILFRVSPYGLAGHMDFR